VAGPEVWSSWISTSPRARYSGSSAPTAPARRRRSGSCLTVLSPFYLYNGSMPLANGFPLVHDMVLAGLLIVVLWIAVSLFERRDIAG
jgi:hypothetical protein